MEIGRLHFQIRKWVFRMGKLAYQIGKFAFQVVIFLIFFYGFEIEKLGSFSMLILSVFSTFQNKWLFLYQFHKKWWISPVSKSKNMLLSSFFYFDTWLFGRFLSVAQKVGTCIDKKSLREELFFQKSYQILFFLRVGKWSVLTLGHLTVSAR